MLANFFVRVEDEFLETFDALRNHCDSIGYDGIENPVDGVFYPQVTTNIPTEVAEEVVKKVSRFFYGVDVKALFLRMTTAGTDCPHECHTDDTMGQYSLMVYLNRLEDCVGGTSFVMHNKTGMYCKPVNQAQEDAWKSDHNKFYEWTAYDMVSMIPNRAVIFDSSRMHRALPVGGFGSGPEDGRLVLTMFFDAK